MKLLKTKSKPANRTKRFQPGKKYSPFMFVNFVLLFGIIGSAFLVFSMAAPLVGLYGSVEQDQADRINYTRAVYGKSNLQHIECLNTVAEEWTMAMVRSGGISHNPSLGANVSARCGNAWTLAGENVGVGYDSANIFTAFRNSPAHNANILDSRFQKMGVGAYWSSDGRLYITQVFARCGSACTGNWATAASLPSDPVRPPTVVGNVDLANCRTISGWSFDKDSSATSNQVHIYVDGGGYNIGNTAVYRGDVNSAYGISGTHGFTWSVPDGYRDGKTHTAYIYGINVAGGPNVLIGQRTLDACANPIGNVDGSTCTNISGWTLDMNDPTRAIDVHIYIDGAGYNTGATTTSRPDVNQVFANYGATGNHGFNFSVPAGWKDGRQHTVNTYGINIGNGGNALIRTTTFGPCN